MKEKKITYVEEGRDHVPGQGESEIPIIIIEGEEKIKFSQTINRFVAPEPEAYNKTTTTSHSNEPEAYNKTTTTSHNNEAEAYNKTTTTSHNNEAETPSPKKKIETPSLNTELKAQEKKRNWKKCVIYLSATIILLIILFFGFLKTTIYNYQDQKDLGYSISTFPDENIEKLQQEAVASKQLSRHAYASREIPKRPLITKSSDVIANVAMNFYSLQNLRAEIVYNEPDTTDSSIYLYSRCADYHTDFNPCGSLVVNGRMTKIPIGKRYGYCAILQNKIIIGVSKQEIVRDYIAENGGYFFRQFVLLSNGEVPKEFYLHGKVERRALARTIDENNNEQLVYVETINKETLRDFANALRDYGFKDAIYITGGKAYCYYRTPDGKKHDIGDSTTYPHPHKGKVPWLVFKPVK